MKLCVALASAFAEDGGFDVGATVRLAAHLRDGGVEGFVIAGTTGEGAHVRDVELRELGLALRRALGDESTIGIGCVRSSREETLRSVEVCLEARPTALLVPPPSAAGEAGVVDFYETLHGLVDGRAEVWAYHWPGRYPPGIPRGLWPDLAVEGFKDSTGDLEALSALPADVRKRVYVGSAALSLEAARMGCRGVILAAANVAPELAAAAIAGDHASLELLVRAEADVKAEFPVSLKRLINAQLDFPLGTRAAVADT